MWQALAAKGGWKILKNPKFWGVSLVVILVSVIVIQQGRVLIAQAATSEAELATKTCLSDTELRSAKTAVTGAAATAQALRELKESIDVEIDNAVNDYVDAICLPEARNNVLVSTATRRADEASTRATDLQERERATTQLLIQTSQRKDAVVSDLLMCNEELNKFRALQNWNRNVSKPNAD